MDLFLTRSLNNTASFNHLRWQDKRCHLLFQREPSIQCKKKKYHCTPSEVLQGKLNLTFCSSFFTQPQHNAGTQNCVILSYLINVIIRRKHVKHAQCTPDTRYTYAQRTPICSAYNLIRHINVRCTLCIRQRTFLERQTYAFTRFMHVQSALEARLRHVTAMIGSCNTAKTISVRMACLRFSQL